jgi:hypothetical protein
LKRWYNANHFFARKNNEQLIIWRINAMSVVHVTKKQKIYTKNETREHFNMAGLPKKMSSRRSADHNRSTRNDAPTIANPRPAAKHPNGVRSTTESEEIVGR